MVLYAEYKILKYILELENNDDFVRQCRYLSELYLTADVASKEFRHAVMQVYYLCDEIELDQIAPDKFYELVCRANNLQESSKLSVLNILKGMQIIDKN